MQDDKWPRTTVGSIASTDRNALVGGPFGSDLVTSDYVSRPGVPVIRGVNMGRRWLSGDFVYVTDAKAEALRANLAQPGDLIFTQRGTLGQVSLVPKAPFDRYLVSQSQMKLTVDRTRANAMFYYYVFSSDAYRDYARRHAIQTGVPHTNLGILRDTPVPLPPLPDQEATIEVLGALDDKIELNDRERSTVNETARTIFKSWFVDFDPVRHNAGDAQVRIPADVASQFPGDFEDISGIKIPVGWNVRPLDTVAHFLNGLALQRYPPTGDGDVPIIKIAQLRKGAASGADLANSSVPPQYMVDDGDVLFSWSGSLECLAWAGGKGALNQHLFKVTSYEFPKWFYYFWILEHLPAFRRIAAGKATTMGHIQRHHLTDAEVIIPPPALLSLGDKILAPMLDKAIVLSVQSRLLAELRDTLSPKLIAGGGDGSFARSIPAEEA